VYFDDVGAPDAVERFGPSPADEAVVVGAATEQVVAAAAD
jgi:hypothetical protein